MWWALGASIAQGMLGAGSQQKQIREQNKQIIQANAENIRRTQIKSDILDAQAGIAGSQEVYARKRIRESLSGYLGSTSAEAAAAGAIGASVDAVASDAQKKASDALAQQEESWEVEKANFQTSYRDLGMNLRDSIQSGVKSQSFGSALLGQAVSSGLSLLGDWATQNMSLGLGPKAENQKGSSGVTLYGVKIS